jgi:F0F1-type ATP synthase membrane subunit b/b'
MSKDPAPQVDGDSLERLLEIEAEIEAQLASCRAEAAGIVDRAREEAVRRGREVEAELREARAERIRAREAAIAEAVREERDRAAHDVRRLRAVDDDRIEELSGFVVRRLLKGTDG